MHSARACRHVVYTCFALACSAGIAKGASPAFQQAIANSQPLLYYQFNETSGAAINHGSLGSAFDGTYNGTVQRGVPTVTGDAGAFFDSEDDYLESASAAPASLTGNPTFSIEALVAVRCNATVSAYPPFLHWGQGGSMAEVFFGLRFADPDRVFAGFFNGGSMSANTTPVGEFMHVVWVRQGGGDASSGTSVYVNGQLIATVADPVLCCDTATPNITSTGFRVNRARDGSRYTTMEMDELALYGRALSSTEITLHYQALPPRSTRKGDLNCDGLVDGADIGPFVTGMLSPATYALQYPQCDIHNGDFDNDGAQTAADIPAFIQRLMLASPTTFQQAILNDQPVLYYQFNEGPGGVINHGTLGPAFNAVFFGSAGPAPSPAGDGAAVFTGPNDYVESLSPAPANFTGNPAFSVEAVVMPTCTTGYYAPLLHWGDLGLGREVFFSFQHFRADRIYAGFYDAGARTLDSAVPPGQWFHVVWVRQAGGDSETGTAVYINGQPVPVTRDTDLCCNPLIPDVTSSVFRINRGSDDVRYFVGLLDEVALYDHTLTPAQVLTHYNALPPR